MTTTKELIDFYAASISNNNTGMMWLDCNGRILKFNQRLADDLKYKKEDLEGKVLFEINPLLNLMTWRELWNEMIEYKHFEHTGEHIERSGKAFKINMRGLLFDLGDEPVCCAFVERIYAENTSLRSPESNVSTLLDTKSPPPDDFSESDILAKFAKDKTGEMIFCFNENGELKYVNKATTERLGYSADEMIGQKVALVNKKWDGLRWEEFMDNLKKEKFLILEENYYTKSGEIYPIEVAASYVKQGDEIFCFAFVKDLTEKREIAIREKLFKTTIDNAPSMICWVNKTADLIYANQEYLDFYGYTWEELRKKKVFEIIDGVSSQEEWEEVYWEGFVSSKGKKHYAKGDITRKNGESANLESYLFYIVEDDKEYICVFVKDITEQIAKEEKVKKDLEKKAKEIERLSSVNLILSGNEDWKLGGHKIITQSKKYIKILKSLEKVAETSATVLVTGETGTGKELLAKSIHAHSLRKDKVFVAINCATISEGLFESQLFGHEKGAFTGAHQTRQGRFEVADGGTIFLDEIGEMPLHLQAKLLRVLQEGEFERVGSTKTIKTDARIVAATNRDLLNMVREDKFREDLYFRLNVFPLHNLPLRDRKEDIPLLVEYFIKKNKKRLNSNVTEVASEDLVKLQAYDFPGNVRELENMVERAMILSDNEVLSLDKVLIVG